MNALSAPPNFFANAFTLGIARARWISEANTALGHETGFLFAYFFQAFANYGLAERMSAALGAAGSSKSVSPVACLLLTGWPFFGAVARMRAGTSALNEVRATAPASAAA